MWTECFWHKIGPIIIYKLPWIMFDKRFHSLANASSIVRTLSILGDQKCYCNMFFKRSNKLQCTLRIINTENILKINNLQFKIPISHYLYDAVEHSMPWKQIHTTAIYCIWRAYLYTDYYIDTMYLISLHKLFLLRN